MSQPQLRSQHPYHMHDAIHQQPAAVHRMLEVHASQAKEVAEQLLGKSRLYLVGIGTSWHAALVAEHWFRYFVPKSPEVQAWHSFEFVAYPPALDESSAVLVISHRGTKTYSFQALELANERGCMTISITSTNPGPRIQAGQVLFNGVEQERSAAFTVSYTSALSILAMLAAQMGVQTRHPGAEEQLQNLRRIPGAINTVLDQELVLKATADRFCEKERFLFTGWGPNTANAYEAALKMKETSFTSTEGFQVEQILHGPFVATNEGCLVILIAPQGPGHRRSLEIAKAAKELGTPTWALVQEGDEELLTEALDGFTLEPMSELWSPLVYVVPLQLFTYFVALARGTNPDLFHQDDPKHAAARTYYSL